MRTTEKKKSYSDSSSWCLNNLVRKYMYSCVYDSDYSWLSLDCLSLKFSIFISIRNHNLKFFRRYIGRRVVHVSFRISVNVAHDHRRFFFIIFFYKEKVFFIWACDVTQCSRSVKTKTESVMCLKLNITYYTMTYSSVLEALFWICYITFIFVRSTD